MCFRVAQVGPLGLSFHLLLITLALYDLHALLIAQGHQSITYLRKIMGFSKAKNPSAGPKALAESVSFTALW